MAISPIQAFAISFAIGFIAGFVFVGLGFGWLAFLIPPQIIFMAQLAIGVVVGFVFGLFGLGFFYLGKSLGKKGLLVIAAALFVLGIVLIQPAVDALAILPVAFALFGVRKR